jgi:hypothetical protein
MTEPATSIDTAARISHRQLLTALGLLLLLGLAALLGLGEGATAQAGGALWKALPLVIVITVAALHRMGKRVDARALEAVRKDELRQASLQRAWRNGFLAVLFLQPVLALGLTWSGAAHGVALMAAVTATLGAATVLASLLWHDR